MSLTWQKEFAPTPDPKGYTLIKSGRSKGAVIFLLYETGLTQSGNRFMMKFLLDGFKKVYWAATEEEIRTKGNDIWSKWLRMAGLVEAPPCH